jgi:hypothetical protein
MLSNAVRINSVQNRRTANHTNLNASKKKVTTFSRKTHVLIINSVLVTPVWKVQVTLKTFVNYPAFNLYFYQNIGYGAFKPNMNFCI